MLDPISRFREIFETVLRSGLPEPTAMALATADAEGRPSVRMVLLKGFDEHGFVFFTNRESRKGTELDANPRAALCFFWQPMETQVRVEGRIEEVSTEEADEYYGSRARGSQIGAWASRQSRPLSTRDELEAAVAATEARFAGQPIPRPPHWTGFRVVPDRIEFWTGRPSRLHDREAFSRQTDGSWRVERLYP